MGAFRIGESNIAWRENGVFLLQSFSVPLSGTATTSIGIALDTPQLERGDVTIKIKDMQFSTGIPGATDGIGGFFRLNFSTDALTTTLTGGQYVFSSYARIATAATMFLSGQIASATAQVSGIIVNAGGTGVISHSATMAAAHRTDIEIRMADPFSTTDTYKHVVIDYFSANTASNKYFVRTDGDVGKQAAINGFLIQNAAGSVANIESARVEVWMEKGKNLVRI